MVFVIVGVDEEVVHVNDGPFFSNHIPEQVRHELLESGGGELVMPKNMTVGS